LEEGVGGMLLGVGEGDWEKYRTCKGESGDSFHFSHKVVIVSPVFLFSMTFVVRSFNFE
jgi:hypothetical protein